MKTQKNKFNIHYYSSIHEHIYDQLSSPLHILSLDLLQTRTQIFLSLQPSPPFVFFVPSLCSPLLQISPFLSNTRFFAPLNHDRHQATGNCSSQRNASVESEKELLQKLAHDCALDLSNPVTFFESGDAEKCLSADAFHALKLVIESVYEHRRKRDLALAESQKDGWAIVCALPAQNTELASRFATRDRVPSAMKGKEKVEGRFRPQRPRSCKIGPEPYPVGLRTAILRSLATANAPRPSSSTPNKKVRFVEDKGKDVWVKEELMSSSEDESLEILWESRSDAQEVSSLPLIVLSSDDEGVDGVGVDFPPSA